MISLSHILPVSAGVHTVQIFWEINATSVGSAYSDWRELTVKELGN